MKEFAGLLLTLLLSWLEYVFLMSSIIKGWFQSSHPLTIFCSWKHWRMLQVLQAQKLGHYEKIQKVVENNSRKNPQKKNHQTKGNKNRKRLNPQVYIVQCQSNFTVFLRLRLHTSLRSQEEGEKSYQVSVWENFLFILSTSITLNLHIGLYSFDYLSLVRGGWVSLFLFCEKPGCAWLDVILLPLNVESQLFAKLQHSIHCEQTPNTFPNVWSCLCHCSECSY